MSLTTFTDMDAIMFLLAVLLGIIAFGIIKPGRPKGQ